MWSDSNAFNYNSILVSLVVDYWLKRAGEDVTVKYVMKLKYISWLLIHFVLRLFESFMELEKRNDLDVTNIGQPVAVFCFPYLGYIHY